ncbi:MAG: cadherin-like domain-containing protein, partial [Chromatiales bacterium]|nr:cadherin-like domain-containing protein [Chromatiales bacterium]
SVITTPVSGPLNGQLVLSADGGFEYTPDSGAQSDSFIYEVTDGTDTAQANVFITITAAQNSAPIAGDDTFEVVEGNSLTIAAPGLLQNDSDADGDPLTVSVTPVVDAGNGSLTLFDDGSFNYTPNAGATGDSFVYQISDGTATTQATVTITVVPQQQQNSPPIAVADSFTVARNSSDLFLNLTGNDLDDDGNLKDASGNVSSDQIIPGSTTTTRRGTLTVTDNGVLYTPRTNFRGTDTFSYQVADQQGALSDSVTVTITVTR